MDFERILIFATETCPKCKQVSQYLKDREIPYSYFIVGIDIRKEELEELLQRDVKQVPVIVFDDIEMTMDQLIKRISN